MVTSHLNRLWNTEIVPLINGVVFKDGTIVHLEIPYPMKSNRNFKIERLTLLKDLPKEKLKDIYQSNVTIETEYYLYMAGEGSWGGDGYVACIDLNSKELLWVFTSDEINPIIALDIFENKVIAINNLYMVFELDIDQNSKDVKIKATKSPPLR